MHTVRTGFRHAVDMTFDIEYRGFVFRCVGVRRSVRSFMRRVDFVIKTGTGSEFNTIEDLADIDIEILGMVQTTILIYDAIIERIRAFQMKAAMESMVRLWGLTD